MIKWTKKFAISGYTLVAPYTYLASLDASRIGAKLDTL